MVSFLRNQPVSCNLLLFLLMKNVLRHDREKRFTWYFHFIFFKCIIRLELSGCCSDRDYEVSNFVATTTVRSQLRNSDPIPFSKASHWPRDRMTRHGTSITCTSKPAAPPQFLMQESRRSPRRLCDGTFDTNNGAHQNGDQPQGFDLGWVGYVHSDGCARLVGFYVGQSDRVL